MKYYKNVEQTIKSNLKVHIRIGDRVKILAGKHRNEQGTVLRVFPKTYRAIVQGMHMMTSHLKPSTGHPKGTIEKREAPLHISNLMLVDPVSGQPTRVGRRVNELGKLQRYSKKTRNFIKDGQA